ncbi:hypothetical protein [Burkholderia sp. 3C]
MSYVAKKSASTFGKLLYGEKHAAPLYADLKSHALQIHQKRTKIAQQSNPNAFHKINTMAESLPASTTEFSLVDKRMHNGKMTDFVLYPSPSVVDTRQTSASTVPVVSTHHGPGYMEAIQVGGKTVHHESVKQPSWLSSLPYFGSAPVTDQALLDEAARRRGKHIPKL